MGSTAGSLGRFLLSRGHKRHPRSPMVVAPPRCREPQPSLSGAGCPERQRWLRPGPTPCPPPSVSRVILYRSVRVETHVTVDTASFGGLRRLGEHSSSAIRQAGEGRGRFCHPEPANCTSAECHTCGDSLLKMSIVGARVPAMGRVLYASTQLESPGATGGSQPLLLKAILWTMMRI